MAKRNLASNHGFAGESSASTRARQGTGRVTSKSGAGAGSSPDHHAGKPKSGLAATPELDRLIHERVRLGILSALAVNRELTFNELKSLLNTTDGNLSVHARKLEEAEYVHCTKSFDGRVPRTEYRLTAGGRRALERYLDDMERIIRTTREG